MTRICAPPSCPAWAVARDASRATSQVAPAPMARPPAASPAKLASALPSEKLPVSAAATAKRRQTRPDASLSSASPCRMCISRRGTGERRAMADTAIGSVGAITAASANATASGITGSSQWMNKPMPSTVNSTSPSASFSRVAASRASASLGRRQPSRNSSGGKKSRKNSSGSSTAELIPAQ